MKRIPSSKRTCHALIHTWILVVVLIYQIDTCQSAGNSQKVNAAHESPSVVVDSSSSKQASGNGVTVPKTDVPVLECDEKDKECEKDKLGLEAIIGLHLLIDDDHNGNVDQSESDEFLRDELQYTDGFERQALFHNNDKLISVDDLWKAWKHSVVYNWTVDDVIEWLVEDVDLPQYSQVFHNLAIDGSVLPRLVNSTGPLLGMLGIRNPVHKQKLSLKAMDTVLFGAPKRVHSFAKDILLVASILFAIGGCWFACLHHRYSNTQVKKMMQDLKSLQEAEESLKKLSKELADAQKNQVLPLDKQEELRILRPPEEKTWQNSLRLKVPRVNGGDKSPNSLSREGSILRRQEGERKLKQAEEELASLREALSEAENRLEIQQQLETQWSVPGELQAWLQLTHELEQLHYNAKRQAAERQLLAARDGCDKIKRRNKAFFGSLRMAHSNSLDDIDQSILDARAALEEVKQDLQERLHRWHTIEILCGFSIMSNPGLSALRQALGREPGGGTRVPGALLAPVSIDEADEDLPPAALLSSLQNGGPTGVRPRALSTDESSESASIYNQIPEKQRQQIFAWARRSRLNYWMKTKKITNGYAAATLPSAGKSSTFLKQQALTGSTGSLSHLGKVATTGGQLVRRGSRENELGGPVKPSTPTGNLGSSASSVSFHLGDNHQHERSLSNASISMVSPSTNGHQHNQGRSSYGQSLSYPPYTHTPSTTPAVSPGLSVSSSTGSLGGNLGTSSLTPRVGNSSYKIYNSPSGNHLATRASSPPSSIAAMGGASSETTQAKHQPKDPGDFANNNILSSNLGGLNQPQGSIPHSTSMTMHAQPQNLNNYHAEDSDAVSIESIPRSQSHSGLAARSRLDRSPELDLSSLDTDSLHSGREKEGASEGTNGKKPSKKKKFLFFNKNKGKQKTT